MIKIKRITVVVLPVLLATMLLLFSQMASATPSGLNNIPTADVTSTNVLVMQQFSDFGSGQDSLYHFGFKYGLVDNLEVGFDKRVAATGAASANPGVFQAKYRYGLPNKDTSLGLGLANVGDSDEVGDSYPYVVLSSNLKTLRGHIGYGGKDASQGLFLGADKTLRGGSVLRADWLQTNDRDESVASIGFLKPLAEQWVVEAWASFPTATGAESTFTLKFDYVFDFRR